MKITDGIKFGTGILICKFATNLILGVGKGVKDYILENDFDAEEMNKIKEYLVKIYKLKMKVEKEDYTKIKIRGFRAN